MVLAASRIGSPLGTLTLIASEGALVAVLWPDGDPRRVPLPATRDGAGHPVLTEASRQFGAYFAGELRMFDLPLDPRGTSFQRAVWDALVAIPFGETRSYAAIARAAGRPDAVRAAGAANGRNPLSIVVPCHRVVGTGGALTGFAGGLAAKRWLLAHEGAGLPLFAASLPPVRAATPHSHSIVS